MENQRYQIPEIEGDISEVNMVAIANQLCDNTDEQKNARELRIARFLMASHEAATA